MKNYFLKLRSKNLLIFTVVAIVVAIFIFYCEKMVIKSTFPILSLTTLMVTLLLVILTTYIILRNYLMELINNSYSQLESLLSIIPIVNPRLPLPGTRGWAASPDFLKIIIENIINAKPRVILELGGGVSTVYIGYVLEKNKFGKIYSVDHLEEYANLTRKRINNHKLDSYVEVIYSPLETIEVKGKKWIWYKNFITNEMKEIDMLIIDGPPETLQSNSRYPALPLLFEYLSDNAIVIIDDYIRKEDKEVISIWLKEYPDLKMIEIDTEKGTVMLFQSSLK